jgi:hypothetical protein
VGITRARHRLTVTYVQSRAKYGRREGVMPSRFLYEMHGEEAPKEVIAHAQREVVEEPEKKPAKKKAKKTAKKRAKSKRRS